MLDAGAAGLLNRKTHRLGLFYWKTGKAAIAYGKAAHLFLFRVCPTCYTL